ncbi:MAG: hypothetical protein VX899_17400 [Myxococcota bacterium]|nr:hypothetical protein [Myxococcota bacterium]
MNTRSKPLWLLALSAALVSGLSLAQEGSAPAEMPPGVGLAPIAINGRLDKLPAEASQREQLRAAGALLGDWTVKLAGVEVNGPVLTAWADTAPDEPFERVVREAMERPLDLGDLILLLDDVLVAGDAGRRGEPFDIGAGRMRSVGALIHPDDVFKNKPRNYPRGKKEISVDTPAPPAVFEPAPDGSVLGPEWSARYPNPTERHELMETLAQARPDSDFAARMESLLRQLEAQGAQHWVTSTVRSRHRGYLMWGAFVMAKCDSEVCVGQTAAMLDERNSAWGLDTQIQWQDPAGWEATVEQARRMKDAYDVVYATEKGARYSNHYGGTAIDVVVVDLPRALHLDAPDGESADFDLSGVEHARDLSLEPALITWIEQHFALRKLTSDYPHWDDSRG